MDKLGQRIRQTRKRKGWSLDRLAKACGSSKSYIWELENKPELSPSFRKVCSIADALHISVNELRGIEDLWTDGYLAGLKQASAVIQEEYPGDY